MDESASGKNLNSFFFLRLEKNVHKKLLLCERV